MLLLEPQRESETRPGTHDAEKLPTPPEATDCNFEMSSGTPYTARTYEPVKEMEVLPRGPSSTVVNVTTTTYQSPPKDHIVWSIFNTVYLNFCCLGFIALVFSVKARDRKVVGDMSGASSYGSTARGLNIAALLLSLLVFIIVIILLATGTIAFQQAIRKHQEMNFGKINFGGN